MAVEDVVEATVFIDRLRINAPIGVDAQERVVGNDFEISVRVSCPQAFEAGESDSLALTVNYGEMVEEVRTALRGEMLLVEHAARRIIDRLKARWPEITGGSVTVAKLAPPVAGAQCASMGVTFRWSR